MRWLLVTACVAGCYSPKVGDCVVACGKNDSCPPGLTCDNAVCRLPEMVGTACSEPADASSTIDINPDDCTWALVSSNFAPADVPDTSPPAWDVTADETFTTGGVDGHAVSQTGASPLWIVHKSRFSVAAGATLTIEGMHPLVIAADEIDIAGTIVTLNGSGNATCDAEPGAPACNNASGGGGGGYGADGGDGGGPPADQGGAIAGITPSPLRGGCPGAKGGNGQQNATDATPQLGGSPGAGGGALQLSARKTLHITGTIRANGFAGGPGRSDHAGGNACPGFTGRGSGGGGGGGGGTLLLESCAIVIEPSAKLCASGGSGGGGAGGGNTDIGVAGNDGSCDMQAIGGAGEAAGANGGNGGFDGLPATSGQQASRGGGGGGGAVGRIHIYQVSGAPVTAGAVIRPPANRSQ
ncbi:MAG TPA: hypothetical protein VMZ53_18640 [Kofleriaceae bacterium]|nr:hypothetical protein [Kofleriaceae bacterium]